MLYRTLVGPATGRSSPASSRRRRCRSSWPATAIGRSLGLIGGAESAELIAAGLLSVLLFPLIGSVLLRRDAGPEPPEAPGAGAAGDAPLMAM